MNDRTIKIVAWKQAINKSSVVVIESFQNFWDKQQQQASRANMMHNMDMLIKLPGIVSGNRLSIIYKIAFVWVSTPWEFSLHSLHMYNNTMSTSGKWNSSYICTLKRTNRSWQESCRPIKPFFWLGIANNLFVAGRHRVHQISATIDWFVENWEACSLLVPCGSRIAEFLIHDWFVR